ncbi:uncharacterized protein LOC134682156 [Mytilus trossulus]|uniref:uncharacterized protein LOC134682156 n=1 Tax=Mytilus trossulus TaxID=6551 RepID=UPI0030042CFE
MWICPECFMENSANNESCSKCHTIKIDTDPKEKEPTKVEAFAWDQASVKHNLPVSVNLRKHISIKRDDHSQHIYSCIKIGNTLLFTDFINKRLIICNAYGTDIHDIPLSYSPYAITQIDSNTVAVSCKGKIILKIDISTCSITNEITTSRESFGISYYDNNLYIVIDRCLMHVMDLPSEEKRTIPSPLEHIVDITVDKNRMVIIERTSIYCCSLDGTQIWKTKKDNLEDFHSVTTDDEQNVYVTNFKKNNVLVISDDGEHYRELFTDLNELKDPWGIYFDKKDKILLVCNDHDAFLFDVR